jgi:hypothetical protein
VRAVLDQVGLARAAATTRASCPAANSSALRSPAPSSPAAHPVCRRTHRQPRHATGQHISDLLFEFNAQAGTHWCW